MKNIFVAIFLSIVMISYSVVFLLKDGSTVSGKLKQMNNETITVITDNGELTIKRDEVKSIYKDMETYKKKNTTDDTVKITEEKKLVTHEEIKGMVLVEGGTLKIGDDTITGLIGENPAHEVTLSSFYIGINEVTQKEWDEVMTYNPSEVVGKDIPVHYVSWFDAIQYCNKKSIKDGLTPCYKIANKNVECDFLANGYRLPTEAEWEFAARGGTKSKGFKYSGSNNLGEVANDFNIFVETTKESGSKRNIVKSYKTGLKMPNELGLYDMSGNIVEWCWDWYDVSYYDEKEKDNPIGPFKGVAKVLRGGYYTGFADSCRVSARKFDYPVKQSGVFSMSDSFVINEIISPYGFRIAKNSNEERSESKLYEKNPDIFYSIKTNNISAISIFLGKGGNINLINKDGYTPLIYALKNNKIDIVKLLINAKASININDKENNSPLIYSVKNGMNEITGLLITGKADVNAVNNEGWTALIYASKKGLSDEVNMLIKAGADVNAKNKDGNNSLMFACKYGKTDVVKLLLGAKVDVDAKNNDNQTALILAVKYSKAEIVDLLKRYSKKISNSNNKSQETINNTPVDIFDAINKDDITFIREYIKNGGEINAKDKEGNTLLMLSSIKGNVETVKYLIEAKADPNVKNNMGNDALMLAKKAGKSEIEKLLSDYDSNLKQNLQINNGNKSETKTINVFESIINNNITELNNYILNGGNVNQKGIGGITLLMQASLKSKTDIIKLLLDAKADINTKDDEGWTALMWAIVYGNIDTVKILIDSKADVNIKNNDGINALMLANTNKLYKIVDILKNSGAKD